MANWAVGDEVFLKSGGDRMTVEEVDGESISCVWFKGSDVKRDTFPAVTLKKAASAEERAANFPKLGASLNG